MIIFSNEFENRSVLVTGGNTGIGAAICLMFAKHGAKVYINYKEHDSKAQETKEKVENIGGHAQIVKADINKYDEVSEMFKIIKNTTDTLDYLVNNAAVVRSNYLTFMSQKEWDDVLNTNLRGAFYCTKFAANIMRKKHFGSIVNITSISAKNPDVANANYAASKAGLTMLTHSSAKELGRFGIRVNAVAPGPVNTMMTDLTQDKIIELTKLTPLGKIATGDDIATVVCFLCSSVAQFLTGQVLTVDGGISL